jgi:hypothetical protein
VAVGVALTTTAMLLRMHDVMDWLSDSISVGTATADALSNAISVVSNALSNEISNRISADNALSNTISNNASIMSQGLSLMSQSISVLSQQVSVLSQAVSVLSQSFSVLSAALGLGQMRKIGTAQVLSAASFTNVSGLSLSVTSAATYDIAGRVLFTISALTGTAFGFTFPAGVSVAHVTMECITSVLAGGPVNLVSTNYDAGNITETGCSTVATTIISILGGASARTHCVEIFGTVNVGATAGTIQLQHKASATGGGTNFLAGSFLRAFRVA